MLDIINEKISEISPQTTLLAVTKTRSEAEIRPLLEKNHRYFAENRVQEAEIKWPSLKAEFPHIQLHLIGSLQTNKAKKAIQLFDCIQTLDRLELAKEFHKLAQQGLKIPDLLIQVNTGEEPQKGGLVPDELRGFLQAINDYNLPVKGLMCIPPVDSEVSLHFKLLKNLSKVYNLPVLSMGMSSDYEIALPFNPTYIRIGTALFS